MNNKVLNYLKNKTHESIDLIKSKAHTLTDYISTKAETVGTYLSDHANDLKNGATKGTALALSVATLLGATGCESQLGSLKQYDTPPIRPIEEIEQTGIKAEDVLALYDDLAEKCVEAHYSVTNWKDLLGDKFYDLDGAFVSITPETTNEIGYEDNYSLPFYLTTNHFSPSNLWSTEISSPYYANNKEFFYEDIYKTNLTVNMNLDKSTDTLTFEWGIPKSKYDEVLSALNTPTTTLNKSDLEGKIPNNFYYLIDYKNLWGTPAFDAIPITRETILNATPNQLWALYNLINCMIELNFNGNLPETSTEESIIN